MIIFPQNRNFTSYYFKKIPLTFFLIYRDKLKLSSPIIAFANEKISNISNWNTLTVFGRLFNGINHLCSTNGMTPVMAGGQPAMMPSAMPPMMMPGIPNGCPRTLPFGGMPGLSVADVHRLKDQI